MAHRKWQKKKSWIWKFFVVRKKTTGGQESREATRLTSLGTARDGQEASKIVQEKKMSCDQPGMGSAPAIAQANHVLSVIQVVRSAIGELPTAKKKLARSLAKRGAESPKRLRRALFGRSKGANRARCSPSRTYSESRGIKRTSFCPAYCIVSRGSGTSIFCQPADCRQA